MLTRTRQRELSAPELSVLRAAAEGLTVPATAERIGRSVETVKSHRKNVIRSLAARNTAHAVAIAYASGILGKQLQADGEITEGQLRAFHAKAAALDTISNDDRGTAKRETLAAAAEHLGRPIESVNDLTAREASWALDHLEELLNS